MYRLKRGMAALLAMLMLLSVMLPAALAEEPAWLTLETPEEETETARDGLPETTGEEIEAEQLDVPDAGKAETAAAGETEETIDPQDLELAALHVTVNGEDAPVYAPADGVTLLPIEEHTGFTLDLSGYFPAELKNVRIEDCVLKNKKGEEAQLSTGNVNAWARWGYRKINEDGSYETVSKNDNFVSLGKNTTFDLSNEDRSYYSNGKLTSTLELIVGTGGQLNPNNKRYIVEVITTDCSGEIFKVESRSDVFTQISSIYSGNKYTLTCSSSSTWDGKSPFAVAVKFNENYAIAERNDIDVQVYKGYHETVEEAEKSEKITAQIWGDSAGGYTDNYQNKASEAPAVTVVLKRNGNAMAIPFYIVARKSSDSVRLDYDLYKTGPDGSREAVTAGVPDTNSSNGVRTYTFKMKKGEDKANAQYYLNAIYRHDGDGVSGDDLAKYVACAVVGKCTPEEALKLPDIKDALFDSNTGYLADYSGEGVTFTIVGKDDNIWYLCAKAIDADPPVENISLSRSLFKGNTSGIIAASTYGPTTSGETEVYTYTMLNAENKADAEYIVYANYYRDNSIVSGEGLGEYVLRAVVGRYTPEEAEKRDDIKNSLFNSSSGYKANYSGEGVTFTIVSKSGKVWYLCAKTVDAEVVTPKPSESVYFRMNGVNKNAKSETEYRPDSYDSYCLHNATHEVDSYADIYQTVFLLNEAEDGKGAGVAEKTQIYPKFSAHEKANVYASEKTDDVPQKSGVPQISEVTPITFQSGVPVQYTVYAEDGTHYQNYWVTFVTQTQGSKLFVNGVTNVAEAHKEDGMARRELRLEDAGSYHDILVANTGDQAIEGLYVRLEEGAKGVVLDDYWTIKEDGVKSLLPFTTIRKKQLGENAGSANSSYGELPNMAKIRLRPETKNGQVFAGIIDATLVIGYTGGDGQKGEEYKVKLSGVTGKLQITTDGLREGVKFVPYLTAIQTNFIGSSEVNSRIKFSIVKGTSETNIALQPTGELYGLPKVGGEWKFTVQAQYEDPTGRLSAEALKQLTATQRYTLVIHDNTDEKVLQVPNTNEYGYGVRQYVGEESSPYHYEISTYGDKVFWSEGEHAEFVNFYMDGELLTDGKDYSHAPGSTVITIFADTTAKKGEGKHTIAAEFFKDGTGASKRDMKTSAQNFYVKAPATRPSSPDGNTPGGSGGNTSGGSSKPSIAGNPAAPGTAGGSGTPSASGGPFSDVAKGNWFYDDVVWAKEMGIMKGVSGSRFNPGATISEATIVTTLARLVGIDEDSYAGETDPDVEPGKWYTVGAIWAKRIGLLPNGTSFTGENPISREEMAIMLVKFLRSLGFDTDPPENPKAFADAELMSAEGNAAFQTLYRLKIFKGVGKSHMDPLGATTRAQFAALMHRIYDIMNG